MYQAKVSPFCAEANQVFAAVKFAAISFGLRRKLVPGRFFENQLN
jgi:hypothetical protein